MLRSLDQDRPCRKVERASAAELVLTHVSRAAGPLGHPLRFSDPLDRRGFLTALTVAVGALAAARGMDLLVFGALPDQTPAFFVVVAAVMLAIPTVALCVRRLRDAYDDMRVLLLLLVPVAGWCLLCFILCRPTRRGVRGASR